MTQETPPSGKHFVQDYLKACGYGYCLPGQPRPPVKTTGNIVQDYINAAGFGLPKKIEAQD
jgi:hypothetical protein